MASDLPNAITQGPYSVKPNGALTKTPICLGGPRVAGPGRTVNQAGPQSGLGKTLNLPGRSVALGGKGGLRPCGDRVKVIAGRMVQ